MKEYSYVASRKYKIIVRVLERFTFCKRSMIIHHPAGHKYKFDPDDPFATYTVTDELTGLKIVTIKTMDEEVALRALNKLDKEKEGRLRYRFGQKLLMKHLELRLRWQPTKKEWEKEHE